MVLPPPPPIPFTLLLTSSQSCTPLPRVIEPSPPSPTSTEGPDASDSDSSVYTASSSSSSYSFSSSSSSFYAASSSSSSTSDKVSWLDTLNKTGGACLSAFFYFPPFVRLFVTMCSVIVTFPSRVVTDNTLCPPSFFFSPSAPYVVISLPKMRCFWKAFFFFLNKQPRLPVLSGLKWSVQSRSMMATYSFCFPCFPLNISRGGDGLLFQWRPNLEGKTNYFAFFEEYFVDLTRKRKTLYTSPKKVMQMTKLRWSRGHSLQSQ